LSVPCTGNYTRRGVENSINYWETIMATGTAPALDPGIAGKKKTSEAPHVKLTLKDRIIRKLSEIFKYNEELGITRQG
jgi:hypothetical protein